MGVWAQGWRGRGRGSHTAQARGAICWPAPTMALVACPVTGVRQPLCVWGCSDPNTPICPLQEAIYSSIPGDEVPKAEQEAKKKKRAEDTYITMVRSCSRRGGAPTSLSPLPGSWHAGTHSPASRAPCPLQTHPGTRGEAHTLSLAPCSTPLTAGTTACTWSWPRGRSRRNGWQRGHRGMDRARSPTAGQRRHFPGLQSGRNSCAVGWQPLVQAGPRQLCPSED